VNVQKGVQYALGVLCNPQPCTHGDVSCQQPIPDQKPLSPMPGCPHPAVVNLTLDLYTPVGAEALGPRPGFVATHSGGYAVNNEVGFKGEMDIACRHFASRGFVAITMVYRLTNKQTGGGLSPANWSIGAAPLPPGWAGGFRPSPQTIYPAVRDTKAAIRWLRGNAAALNLATDFVGAGGWSAGASTTVYLASQRDADFTYEMSAATDPTFDSLALHLQQPTGVGAGVVWAGNGVVTDTIDAQDKANRYATTTAPLAMYRGSEDTVMTPWAQAEVQAAFNASGARCDLFGALGVGHSSLFPGGNVTSKNGMAVAPAVPIMNHSYLWMAEALGLVIQP